MTLLRGTLHIVTARDAIALRALVQPGIERVIFGSSPLRKAVGSVDMDELLAALRAWLEERPRRRAELVKQIAARWPDADTDSLGYAMYALPTVQVTPRGLWRRSRGSAFTTMEAWLGMSPDHAADVETLLLRYLAAFGPATPADATHWSGVPGLHEVFERLGPRLRTVRDEDGRKLFDVPRAPLPGSDVPAPVRSSPKYDNVVIGHKDRTRIVPDGVSRWTEVGWGSVLVDGTGAARWRLVETKPGPTLRIESFRRLKPQERRRPRGGHGLAAFLTSDPNVRVELWSWLGERSIHGRSIGPAAEAGASPHGIIGEVGEGTKPAKVDKSGRTSAGIMLWRRRCEGLDVLLGHNGGPFFARKNEGHWTVLKGEVEAGEDVRAVARREFTEETGHEVPDGPMIELGQIRQRSGKVVMAWAIEGDLDPDTAVSNTFELEWPPGSGRIQAFPEIDRVAWFGLPEARRMIKRAQAPFLDRLEASTRTR
jgi:predicted NUDIX family NTP pyrophosphohydrolase